ncbi:MAG: hypothetical protein ABIN24_06100 [Dyadobacter sp.]
MNLHSALQYPFLKYFLEDFTGKFYQNDLTCLNRILILFHNRYIYSITDNASNYLNELEHYLEKSNDTYWYLKKSKQDRIRLIRARMLFVLQKKRQIFEDLLARKDYSSPEAKQHTINLIYHWLKTLPEDVDPVTGLDINTWRQDIEVELGHLLQDPPQETEAVIKLPKRPSYHAFYQILNGKDEQDKKEKFQRLVDKLIQANWIFPGPEPDIYLFKNSSSGGRLEIASLYYALNKNGHIEQQLSAPEVAALFDTWLSHQVAKTSFVKIFQSEQQLTFNANPRHRRARYVKDCELLISGL